MRFVFKRARPSYLWWLFFRSSRNQIHVQSQTESRHNGASRCKMYLYCAAVAALLLCWKRDQDTYIYNTHAHKRPRRSLQIFHIARMTSAAAPNCCLELDAASSYSFLAFWRRAPSCICIREFLLSLWLYVWILEIWHCINRSQFAGKNLLRTRRRSLQLSRVEFMTVLVIEMNINWNTHKVVQHPPQLP